MPADAIKAAYLAACHEEIEAPKPGNVHVFADGHGMVAEDFRLSATVSAEPLCRRGASVGERVLGAVTATRAAAGQNTNLGIVLLCAPLAAAAERKSPLRRGLEQTLKGLTMADAADVFRAIALAAPGGLGEAYEHDVRQEPKVGLLEAMAAAAGRDCIAKAYVTGFADIFEIGLPAYALATKAGRDHWWPATAVYLAFLVRVPDTHIARKQGIEAAEGVRLEASRFVRELEAEGQVLGQLLAFDQALKSRKLNPGTSADFTVATLFAARLDKLLREGADNG